MIVETINGTVYAGSIINILEMPNGYVESGHSNCVPYTVKLSSKTWVLKIKKMATDHLVHETLLAQFILSISQANKGLSKSCINRE